MTGARRCHSMKVTEPARARTRVELPADATRPFEVYVNGVLQREGVDFRVRGRTLVFERELRREGRLGLLALGVDGDRRRRHLPPERLRRRRLRSARRGVTSRAGSRRRGLSLRLGRRSSEPRRASCRGRSAVRARAASSSSPPSARAVHPRLVAETEHVLQPAACRARRASDIASSISSQGSRSGEGAGERLGVVGGGVDGLLLAVVLEPVRVARARP